MQPVLYVMDLGYVNANTRSDESSCAYLLLRSISYVLHFLELLVCLGEKRRTREERGYFPEVSERERERGEEESREI